MAGAKLAAAHHHHELAPVIDEMLRPLLPDAAHDDRIQPSLQSGELLLCEPQIPPVAVAYLHVLEAGAGEGGCAFLERDHVVGDSFEPEEFHHLGRVAPRPTTQPVAGDKAPARA